MKDSQPLVSIGMPVYNGEPFLRGALDSLLAQDYENFELIISDNGSVDATPEICQEYLIKDRRIRYHRNTSNLGQTSNFLRVLELGNGQYFMWAAHDDLWESSFITKLMAPFLNHDDVVLACCDFDIIYHLSGKTESHTPLVSPLSAKNSVFENAIWMITVPISNFFYGIYATETLRTSRFIRLAKPYDFSDLLLLNEISLTGKVHFVPELLFHSGVRDEVRLPISFAKRRLPKFKFAYKMYYIEGLKCIAHAKRIKPMQKLYLMHVLTNQVLELISHHEPLPEIFRTTIRAERHCSTRVADRLISLFGG